VSWSARGPADTRKTRYGSTALAAIQTSGRSGAPEAEYPRRRRKRLAQENAVDRECDHDDDRADDDTGRAAVATKHAGRTLEDRVDEPKAEK